MWRRSHRVFELLQILSLLFFFNDTATTEIYTLSLHDALPISGVVLGIVLSVGLYFVNDQLLPWCKRKEYRVHRAEIGRAHV